ncbi:MAG: hypothetical protein ACREIV_03875 [Planctomycetaceae bacterium]
MTDERELDAGPFEDQDDYEIISSDEVDRIVGVLGELMESVESENIKCHLEEALDGIYYLVYDDEEDEEGLSEAA